MRVEPAISWGMGIPLVASLPPLAPILAGRLPLVVLGLYPLIIIGGALAGGWLARGRRAEWTAAPALSAAVLTLGFWLLPRWIDAALADPLVWLLRALSLWLLAGVPLGWGWAQAGPVLRGFLLANVVSMLAVMGWLQLAVPARLCNAYLLSDQRLLGAGFLAAAAGLTLAMLAAALLGNRRGHMHMLV